MTECFALEKQWDIAINKHNCIIAITQTGVITEYDPKAEVLFSFGGRALSSERGGYFTKPVAVDVDDNDFIYILDQERALVQVYFPTEFANATHRAVDAYESGDYAGSLELWEDLLLLNNMSKVAHNGYGAALFALNRYEEALEEFAFTYNRTEYSETYWEIRNVWITRYITQVVTGLIIGALVLYAVSIWNRRTKVITNFLARLKPRTSGKGLIAEVTYMGALMRHPVDAYYNLKTGRKGSVRAAVIIYILAFTVYIVFSLLTALLFRPYNNINVVSPVFIVSSFFVPLAAWVIGNYMVSSINDGEGSFKNVFVCTAYAFAPFILMMPFVVVLSYALTLNESFIIVMANTVIIGWTALNFYLMVQEVHNFNFRNSMLNILLTLFAILIAIIGFLIVYLMVRQAISFFADLYREVLFRAT